MSILSCVLVKLFKRLVYLRSKLDRTEQVGFEAS